MSERSNLMVPTGPPAKVDGERIYFRSIQCKETGVVYRKHDDVFLLNTDDTRFPYVGKIDAIWVKDNVSYVRTKWYYRLFDIVDEDDRKKIPPYKWSEKQEETLKGIDAGEYECFLNPTHMDTNEASSILGPCDVLNVEGFMDYIDAERKKDGVFFHALKNLQDVLFCRFKYSTKRGTYTAYTSASRYPKHGASAATSAKMPATNKRKRSSSSNLEGHEKVSRSRSASESPSTNISTSGGGDNIPANSSSSVRQQKRSRDNSSTSNDMIHCDNTGLGGSTSGAWSIGTASGSGIKHSEGLSAGHDGQGINSDEDNGRNTPDDLPRFVRVGGKYQLDPAKELPAPGTFRSTRSKPEPIWLASITKKSDRKSIDKYLHTAGASDRPDNFHEFALGALMHANGNLRVAMSTLRAVGQAPPPTPVYSDRNRSSKSSSDTSRSSLSLSEQEAYRRKSSRVKAIAKVMPKYGNDLDPDFMSPEWATRVITGLGRLLVPYHSPREKVGGRAGGILAGSPKPKGASSEDESMEEDRNSDFCSICHRAGKLLCCDGCDAAFHLACVNLRTTPRNKEWLCMPCKQRQEMADYIDKNSK